MLGLWFRDPSMLLAITVIGVTVLMLALKSINSRRKYIITLQDPDTTYLLPLIEKDVLSQPYPLPWLGEREDQNNGNAGWEVVQISHNTQRFRFGLPSPDHVLGLPIGNHVHLSARIDGDVVLRAYTPISSDDDRGFVDLLIKIYFKNVHPHHPEGGKMTQYLENMKTGDTILFQGPSGCLFYCGPGRLAIKTHKTSESENKLVYHLGMFAGGTGITPMLQLIRHITKNPSDNTRISLLFANQTEEDILMRKELEGIFRTNLDQFNLWYTLDRAPASWRYSSGFVTANMIKEHLPPPGKAILILVCRPPPMIQTTIYPNLKQLGYTKDMIFTY